MNGLSLVDSPVSVRLPLLGFNEYIYQMLTSNGERLFLIDFESGATYTYKETLIDCLRCAKILKNLGLGPGNIFVIHGYNSYHFFVTYFAAIFIGATAVACRAQDKYCEVKDLIKTYNVKFAFISLEFPSIANSISTELKNLQVVCYDGVLGGGIIALQDLMAASHEILSAAEIYAPQDSQKECVAIIESSGTTGPTKGSMISHTAMVATFLLTPNFVNRFNNERVLLHAPMAHISAVLGLVSAVASGNSAVLLRAFDLNKFVAAIEKYQVTQTILTPSILYTLTSTEIRENLSSWKTVICGSARLAEGAAEKFFEKYGKKEFVSGYSLTETTTIVTIRDASSITYHSVGKVAPMTKVKIVDVHTRKVVRLNEQGEILVKCPVKFLGYYNNPEATTALFDEEGWLKTGDIGYFDENQELYIVDRIKEMISQNGVHIPPTDVEEILLKHPSVKEVCVVGIPHPVYEEAVHAFVVLRSGSLVIAPEELKEFVNERMSDLKAMKGDVHFVEWLPKTPTGKVLRRKVRENFLEDI